MQEIVRATERQVRNDAEGLSRQLDDGCVSFDDGDVVPATAEAGGQPRIELDRDHSAGYTRELSCEPPCSRAEVDDDVVPADAGVADELCCQGTGAEEVLATRCRQPRAWCAPACHGRPGS